jgi:hypothetical protein
MPTTELEEMLRSMSAVDPFDDVWPADKRPPEGDDRPAAYCDIAQPLYDNISVLMLSHEFSRCQSSFDCVCSHGGIDL